MEITLGYGSGQVTFRLPDDNVGRVIRPGRSGDRRPAGGALAREVERAVGRVGRDFKGRRVLVLLADGTRDQPHRGGFAALAPLLRPAGSVHVLIATGTHQPDTPENRRILDAVRAVSADEGLPLVGAEAHDARSSPSTDLGTTRFGIPVALHRQVDAAEVVCVVSDMKPHYFAGYSNPAKFLLPGVARFDSTERDHAFALDPGAAACRHPLHPDPARRRNPVAENELEAARMVAARRPVYALASVGGSDVTWASFGLLEDVVADGIRQVDADLTFAVARRYRRAVISCGGYPNDQTLYIAQRSLELTKEAVADGAEVLWLAECRNGIASTDEAARNFFEPLKGDAAAYAEAVRADYVMYGHKAVRFFEMLDRLAALHVATALPRDTLDGTGLVHCPGPAALVERWAGDREPILFVDGASTLALRRAAGVCAGPGR
ncbi:MAG: lactate racemase domain-containing protein [bacterium]